MLAVSWVVVTLFFQSSSMQASTLKWPKQMYTSNGINKSFFRELKSYFDKVQKSFPYQWADEDKLFVYEGNRPFFSVHLQRWSVSEGCVGHMVSFIARRTSSRRLLVKNCAPERKELALRSILDSSFLEQLDNYEINFIDWNFRVTQTRSGGEVHTVYDDQRGRTRIILYEREEAKLLYSKLYFSCRTCNGDPLIAKLEEKQGVRTIRYYMGIPTAQASALNFFNMANNGYLGFIFRKMPGIVSSAVNNDGWPRVE